MKLLGSESRTPFSFQSPSFPLFIPQYLYRSLDPPHPPCLDQLLFAKTNSLFSLSGMEYTHPNAETSTAISASASNPFPSLPTSCPGPCAACKILRRRCTESCMLAPYFPPTETLKFLIAHKVFGASNIVKALQELPESKRADAVSSMVYEAHARIRDPVYGCAGAISNLQKQVTDLQAELATAQAQLLLVGSQQPEQSPENVGFYEDQHISSFYPPAWQ